MSFVPCDICKDSKIKGHILQKVNNQLFLAPCECYTKWKKEEKIKISHKKANIPEIITYSFDDYKGDKSKSNINKFKAYIDNFRNKSKKYQLYFFGDYGSQKTTIAMIIAAKLLLNKYKVYYMYMDDLVELLSIFENQLTEENKKKIEIIESVDLLIIDECFAQKNKNSVSDFKQLKFLSFIKSRIEVYQKGTIFISNKKRDSISSIGYNHSIQKLISRNTYLFEFLDNIEVIENDFDPYDLFK